MTDFACWKCVSRAVTVPGEMCDTCAASADRRSRRTATGERRTQTHRDTEAKYGVPWKRADIEQQAYRDWSRLTE